MFGLNKTRVTLIFVMLRNVAISKAVPCADGGGCPTVAFAAMLSLHATTFGQGVT